MKRRIRQPNQQERLTALFRTFSYLTAAQIARALDISTHHARVLLGDARKTGVVHSRHYATYHAYRTHRVVPQEVTPC